MSEVLTGETRSQYSVEMMGNGLRRITVNGESVVLDNMVLQHIVEDMITEVPPKEVGLGDVMYLTTLSEFGELRTVNGKEVTAVRRDDGILRLVDRTGKVLYNSETHAGMTIGVVR